MKRVHVRPCLIGRFRMAGPRYYPFADVGRVDVFVQRSAERGRPWLRFTQNANGAFDVMGADTLREAIDP